MTRNSAERTAGQNALPFDRIKNRFAAYGDDPNILADIYREDINIAIWQRPASELLAGAVAEFLAQSQRFEKVMTVSPESARAQISAATGGTAPSELVEDAGILVEMFCELFGLQRAGLRLVTLDRAMCPRFHVDRVPCRMLTTYSGVATEWLPHQAVDRTKLGPGSGGLPDVDSGLFSSPDQIRRLDCGHVALLKGELWSGNEDAGLVHRSPSVPADQSRLLFSLDFSN